MARIRNPEKFDAQRAVILAAAADCFVRQGFHAASMANIALAAGGISAGRLYHYFPSKDSIVEALVAEERAEMTALFDAVFNGDPKADLLKAVRSSLQQAIDPEYAALAAEITAEAARNPEIERIVRHAERAYRELLIAALAAIRETSGAWPASRDDRMARAVTMLIDGAIVRSLLEPSCRRTLPGEVIRLIDRLLS